MAEILYARSLSTKDGKPAIKWGRVLAQGQVRLPTNSELQINLRFDGLEHLDQLAPLNACKVGCFSASELDFEDKHLQYLKGFKELRVLDLSDTLVTDKSLPQIEMFSKLTILNLLKANVTGSGFASLNSLHKLFDLSIEGTSLASGNFAKLVPILPQLVVLRLARTNFSKSDAPALQHLKKCRLLTLSSNGHLDDDCVKYLIGLDALSILDISDTAITEKSIPLLTKLKSLKDVRVRDKTFWQHSVHHSKYGQITFVDIANYSDAPTEVFRPLH